MRLFLAHRRQIYGVARALVANEADAEDLVQDTSARMWQKFDEFEPGTHFVAWARSFLCYGALDANRKRRRSSRLVTFDDDLLNAIVNRLEQAPLEHDHREEALRSCLEQLPPASAELVQMRYTAGTSLRAMSAKLGRPVESISKSLSRIRLALGDCINRKLANGGLR